MKDIDFIVREDKELGIVKEQLVRCKDCKFYRRYNKIPVHKDWCLRGSGDYCVQVYPNGFCAWGERKEQ